MVDVLLFHHALGQTKGFHWFADRLRAAGHTVTTPDLYGGETFDNLTDGMAKVRSIGFGTILSQGAAAAEDLPLNVVYIGISLGVMPAQLLAQTRPGARGAVLISACIPLGEFGDAWPEGVPLEIHGMDGDEEFALSGDLEAAQAIVESTDDAELFIYSGTEHMLVSADPPGEDEFAPRAATQAIIEFLDGL